jgi:RIO-like serine/threonine protein kinase
MLEGIEGIPRFVGCVGPAGIAIEYIEAMPLDYKKKNTLPPGLFDQWRRILDQIHERGVAYVDANKRSNMLIGQDGKAWLVDFQISLRRRDDWLWPFQAFAAHLVEYLQEKDLYHLYKHKRRMAKAELTSVEEKISRRRTGLHKLHTQLTTPYRAIRRFLLRRSYAKGHLVSPSAKMEDHFQPEKKTWRKP